MKITVPLVKYNVEIQKLQEEPTPENTNAIGFEIPDYEECFDEYDDDGLDNRLKNPIGFGD